MKDLNIIKSYIYQKSATNFIKKIFTPKTSLPNNIVNNIALIGCNFDLSGYDSNLFKGLNIQNPESIKKSVPKRQAEYLAGRFMAQKALEKLGIVQTDIPIGEHRCPKWPTGINAAISHSNNTALCIAVKKSNHQYVGIDVEPVLSWNTITKITNSIINNNETQMLLSNTLNYKITFSIVFSAKEALFKALYPNVGYYFDFNAAEVINICSHSNQFKIKLTQDLTSILAKGSEFDGYYTIRDGIVTTYIIQ